MSELKEIHLGKKYLVFDANSWSTVGDKGDNSEFWKEAFIVRKRQSEYGESLVDVCFTDGKLSNGHFENGLKSI